MVSDSGHMLNKLRLKSILFPVLVQGPFGIALRPKSRTKTNTRQRLIFEAVVWLLITKYSPLANQPNQKHAKICTIISHRRLSNVDQVANATKAMYSMQVLKSASSPRNAHARMEAKAIRMAKKSKVIVTHALVDLAVGHALIDHVQQRARFGVIRTSKRTTAEISISKAHVVMC